MANANPIQELIDRWPNRKAFADEVGANVEIVHKWAKNGRIPSGWQRKVQIAAVERGQTDVTPEWMLDVHANPPPPNTVQEVASVTHDAAMAASKTAGAA